MLLIFVGANGFSQHFSDFTKTSQSNLERIILLLPSAC